MIKNLVLVGCGHMGYAMLQRWVETGAAVAIKVVTPNSESLHGLDKKGVQYIQYPTSISSDDEAPDVIVFAVKPQILPDVLKDYRQFHAKSLYLSIAAGKTLDFYVDALGGQARVIRAMPNLPVKSGEGATLLVRNTFTTRADAATAEQLLSGLGMVAWLEKEALMDTATALSGCGPAYFYLLADLLAKAATELGLPPELSAALARQTFLGSATLWREDNLSAETLYRNIAVKGGMTEAALNVFQDQDALKTLIHKALDAAAARGKTLAK
jgi:pyrroline-5-carboxylate reductase